LPTIRRSSSIGVNEDLKLVLPALPPLERYVESLEQIWRTKMMSNSDFVRRFEQLAREYTGQRHAHGVVSCDVGLTLAIAALQVRKGSEVIMPSFTFNSTCNAVIWNGLRPRFVDVDSTTYCVDPAAVDQALGERTGLILGTHVFGVPCAVEKLDLLAKRHQVPLMFDAAQAFGAFVGDAHVAAFGDASVFSFSESKVVTSGQGGLAVFADEEPADRFQYLRAYGFQGDYVTRYVGLNGKMSEILAALACLSMPTVEAEIAQRTKVVELYRSGLAHLDGVRFQEAPPGMRTSPIHLALDVGEARDRLAAHLAARGIPTKVYFYPLHQMPIFEDYAAELPVTDRLANSLLCLPLHSGLSQHDVERICDEIESILRER
jgi:dTDP-4-amino-4,6-dideoxygalactose transaminase